MDELYTKILEKAIPFYARGRENDIIHIKWLCEAIPQFVENSEIDFDLLMPLIIFHDIGYSDMTKNSDPQKHDTRKMQSQKSAKIAERILKKLGYSSANISEIQRLILKHDAWAEGNSFSDEPLLKLFSNFDFLWLVSKEGFKLYKKRLHKSAKSTYQRILFDVEKGVNEGRMWYNDTIKKLYRTMLADRREEYKI